MARTVKVELLLEAARYIRGGRQAAKTTKGVTDAVGDLGDASTETSAKTEHLGDELGSLARDARRLDRQIDQTKDGIRELARQIAATSDAAERAQLNKKLNLEGRTQRQLIKLRDLIEVDGAGSLGGELAEQVSVSFAARLGPLIARAPMAGMNPAALAIAAPLAAGAALTVGTAMAGAIVGGVGIGGVVGGMKLAAKDPAVKAAGAGLGTDLGAMLGRASAAFVPETLGAIDIVRQRTLAMEPDFRRAFNGAARYVYPLTDALMDAGQNAMPGVIAAIEHAGPVVDALGDGLRDLGSAVGDSLSHLSQYADEGARALDVLFFVVENGLRSTAAMIGGMAELYGWAEKLGAVMTGRLDRLGALVAADNAAEQSSRGLGGAFDDVRNAARGANREADEMIDVLTTLNGLQLSVNDAERSFQRAIDDARESFTGKTRDLVGATEKGREYGANLDEIATKARNSGQAIFDQSGNVALANAKIEEGRAALYRQAVQYGRTDQEARDYVNSVLSIPQSWTTKVDMKAEAALREAKALRSVIQSLKDRNITIGVYWKSNGDLKVPGGTILKNERGGLYEHADVGLLREAQIASPRGPARYAWAEPATGGELFAPKYGDMNRTRALVGHAVENWWGGWQNFLPPAPAGPAKTAAPASGSIQVNLRAYSDRFSLSQVMSDLEMRGVH
ncbi:hypothetical protein ACFY3B_19350 [Micromonospora parva]|uniref:Uncharacterized protein n=1 Tax=Micromonospora parva TaxID=1464048 RepID=A0ABW6VWL4_9ACTN